MLADQARFLVSAAGAALLDAAACLRGQPLHARPAALQAHGSPQEVRWALAQDDLRQRALARIPQADRLLFTADTLEQATAWAVAEERARRWNAPLSERLTDLGSGIGIDALAVAAAGRPVLAVEREPARALLLAHNARVLGVAERLEVLQADLRHAPPGALAFLDPDRRPGGQRTREPEASEPPRSSWREVLAPFDAAIVKAAPSDRSLLDFGCPLEVVSLQGSARELRLFLGGWTDLPPRRALALPTGAAVEGEGLPWPEPEDPQVGQWLLDPDPAVWHAQLVGDLARRERLRPLAPDVPYLLGAAPSAGCPGHWVEVQARLKPSTVQAWLRTHQVGRVTIRKRGVPWRADDFRRSLSLHGPAAATLVLTCNASGRRLVLAGLEASPGAVARPDD